ncbi:MAG: metal ABC transporter permease [Chloroflexi bacterium]|nr:metal ABC transporter permease [Chloroflexota bacterium]
MGVIIVTAALVAAAGALLGPFLLLRKLAMLTDALSHAILPGIVAAYFLARGPNLLAAFLGATVAGLLTAAGVAALQRSGRLHSDAAIGTVFPALFALGVFLVSRFFAHVHLDTDAVLAGNLEFAAAELLIVGDTVLGPQALWVMGGLLAADALFVFLCFKELKLTTFDPQLAACLGFAPGRVHAALLAMVSLTAVGGLTAVGAVLVVALFIVPAATALLLSERLGTVLGLAVALGVSATVGGCLLAFWLDISLAGAIASVAGAGFGLALLVSPRQGVLTRWWRQRSQRGRCARLPA